MIKSAFTRRSILATGSGLALALALTACGGNVASTSSTADASKFPAGPVTLTIGADPGGSTDLIGRALGCATRWIGPLFSDTSFAAGRSRRGRAVAPVEATAGTIKPSASRPAAIDSAT
jgi:hypothetical protein